MRINPFVYGLLVMILFFGTILGFQSAGIWSISGKVNSSGEAVQPSAADVNTIKGWMTLEQIATTFNVPLADLLKQFDLPGNTPPTTAIKELESVTFDTTALRTWLQSRMEPADSIQPSDSFLPTYSVVPTQSDIAQTTPDPTIQEPIQKTITGKTTFQELLDWGVSQDAIQSVLGSELPSSSLIVKDYVTGKGLEFSTVKTQLQALVD